MEIKAKLPLDDWIFPQLLLESLTNPYGTSGLTSGQMRIAYIHAGSSSVRTPLSGGALLGAKEPIRSLKMCNNSHSSVRWNEAFHVYTLEWTPG